MRRLTATALAAFTFAGLCGPATALEVKLAAEQLATGLDLPLYAVAPPDDPRLFVVEQTGTIRIVKDGALTETPFLDLGDKTTASGERGLLGLAFHPDYAENGRFFVNYTDRAGDTRIVAYTVSDDPDVADPASATELLAIDQPYGNHNGGWLGFGPDGLLYIGTGDGGAGGDPQNRAQNPDTLLGKLLRIDVDAAAPYAIPSANPFAGGAAGRPEIFATGLRNPWRIDFDGNDIYIADVGQGAQEEISVISTEDAGANLGWNITEGTACYGAQTCDTTGLTAPVHAYSHADGGCSITGGYVYRGTAIPELDGQYFYADFCGGFVRSFAYADGTVGEITDWTDTLNTGAITSFGEDAAGELYLTTIEGDLYRIVAAD
ncbi:PQQ-dependent sugar dehydrogenase [Devosia sp.]|uniref:PQQ-dependent sugar dehydrogenase n=1 Tax=Devosia sp. TaxID=1871048 RepID=UPI003A8EEF2F